jgi:hypothetical protein
VRTGFSIVFCLLLSSCALLPSPPSRSSPAGPTVHVSNSTPLTISIEVNGQKVAESDPSNPEVALPTANLGNPPWRIDARGGTTGRILVALVTATGPGAGASSARYVDLSCGRIWLWVGEVRPDAPRGPASDQPGDCPG